MDTSDIRVLMDMISEASRLSFSYFVANMVAYPAVGIEINIIGIKYDISEAERALSVSSVIIGSRISLTDDEI